jgi:Regulator of ribonuclease activity B
MTALRMRGILHPSRNRGDTETRRCPRGSTSFLEPASTGIVYSPTLARDSAVGVSAPNRPSSQFCKATLLMSTEDPIQSAVAEHRRRNAELKNTLADKGVDLAKKRPVDVYFWCDDRHAAAMVAKALYAKGFLVTLLCPSKDPDRTQWSVEAGALISPDEILGDHLTASALRDPTCMFQLNEVVPWGRSFDEYCRMFALSDEDLTLRILGCCEGPASFNAKVTRRGSTVISCDPIYRWHATR